MKRIVYAADNTDDTRIKDASDILKDDFNYVIDGLQKLHRMGAVQDALDIANQLSDSIQMSIQQIGKITGE